MKDLIITECVSALVALDRRGKRLEYEARYCSAFIFTRRGRIRFSFGGSAVYASAESAVFLPEGLKYVNDCLEDAESIVINFRTAGDAGEPIQFPAPPFELVLSVFEKLGTLLPSDREASRYEAFSQLYLLAAKLFSENKKRLTKNPFVEKALLCMRQDYADPSLSVAEIARRCRISEVYLRKLFSRELGVSPREALFDIRMQRAALLAKEKRPLAEIAAQSGYSDVFQLSRAFRRRFGYPPSRA